MLYKSLTNFRFRHLNVLTWHIMWECPFHTIPNNHYHRQRFIITTATAAPRSYWQSDVPDMSIPNFFS